eukprot:gene3666-15698_t
MITAGTHNTGKNCKSVRKDFKARDHKTINCPPGYQYVSSSIWPHGYGNTGHAMPDANGKGGYFTAKDRFVAA